MHSQFIQVYTAIRFLQDNYLSQNGGVVDLLLQFTCLTLPFFAGSRATKKSEESFGIALFPPV